MGHKLHSSNVIYRVLAFGLDGVLVMVVSWVLKLLSMSRKVEVYLLSLVICIIPGDVAVRRSEQF